MPCEEVPATGNGESRGNGASHSPTAVAIEIQGELITNEIANRIIPRLSEMQQQILFLLMKGCGVRQTGREIGITHPAVIKHRKKIARIAREFLQESAGSGVVVAVQPGAIYEARVAGVGSVRAAFAAA